MDHRLLIVIMLVAACRSPDRNDPAGTRDAVSPSPAPAPAPAPAPVTDAPASEKKEQQTRPDLEGLAPRSNIVIIDPSLRVDGIFSGRIAVPATDGAYAGLVFRMSSATDYHMIRIIRLAGANSLEHAVSVARVVGRVASVPLPAGSGLLQAKANGDAFDFLLDGELKLSTRFVSAETPGSTGWVSTDMPVTEAKVISPLHLSLRSVWSSSCTTSGIDAQSGGSWSGNLVTSNWNGGPWSCLNAKIASSADVPAKIHFESYWGSDCQTTEQMTGWTPADGSLSEPNAGLITSSWNGAPWSCLKARLGVLGRHCRLHLKSQWGSSGCQTGEVSTELEPGQTLSAVSASLITSDWNGGPWSCLTVQLECDGD